MKKNYVCPQIDIIYTKMEDALLKVSDGNAGSDDIGSGGEAKAYSGDLDDFTDESFWNDENRWK